VADLVAEGEAPMRSEHDQEVFALYDAITLQDLRLAELFGAADACGHRPNRAERRKLAARRGGSGARRGRTI